VFLLKISLPIRVNKGRERNLEATKLVFGSLGTTISDFEPSPVQVGEVY